MKKRIEGVFSRRAFLGGALKTVGGLALPGKIFAADGTPLLTFGMISDVHIGGRKKAPERLEFALRWLDARHVDAILCSGDIAHGGRIDQIERFAAVWYKVFPNGKGSDGRKMEFMFSTGNHDAEDCFWGRKPNPDYMRKCRFCFEDNAEKTMQRLFGQKFELVWQRQIRGFTFIGAQFPSLKPDLAGYMAAHAKELDPSKPFFYCQHCHPTNTCHGSYGCSSDRGLCSRVFAKMPNAVVFSGDSHCSIVDERTVWQGEFTSIGAGCLHEGGLSFKAANAGAFWYPPSKKNIMSPLNDAVEQWGGDPDGGCFELVEVYDDHLIVHRRSSLADLAIGPSWLVPLPAQKGGACDFTRRAARRAAPQFAADAELRVRLCPKGHPAESKSFQGQPCVHVSIPPAAPVDGCRVFTYEIEVKCSGRVIRKDRLFAAGFASPPEKAARATDYLVALRDLPAGESVTFSVTPIECYGKRGRSLASAPLAAAL